MGRDRRRQSGGHRSDRLALPGNRLAGLRRVGEPARNVLGAAAFGGAAGGFFKGLGMAWGRAKTGVWPRSIRDAGNVVESEAQVAQSNVLPGLEGEVAHRDALAKTIDDVVAGRKVEVPPRTPRTRRTRPSWTIKSDGSRGDCERAKPEASF
jgi:hypothetical protein